jgi:hypothetical protein
MYWDVREIMVSPPLELQVSFLDGTRGVVRFEPSHLTGVFASLRNPATFAEAYIEGGAVTWPGGVDLAPDAMYAAIRETGEWVLR